MALGLTGVVALTLVGCSSNTSDVKEDTSKKTESDGKTDEVVKDKDTEKVDKEVKDETKNPDTPIDMEVSIKEAIQENALDMQKEDITGYMDDIIIPEENIESTKQALTQFFEAIDATYEIKNINILEKTDTTVKVEVTQVTKSVKKSDAFKDNETITIHTLQLVDGKWKFESSEVKSVTYL